MNIFYIAALLASLSFLGACGSLIFLIAGKIFRLKTSVPKTVLKFTGILYVVSVVVVFVTLPPSSDDDTEDSKNGSVAVAKTTAGITAAEKESNSTAEPVKEENKESETETESSSAAETTAAETIEQTAESTQETTEETEEETLGTITQGDDLKVTLTGILGEAVGNKLYDIVINQIGFTDVEYLGKMESLNNFKFRAGQYPFIVTAFEDDDVYRIFQESGGIVFYEDGKVLKTYAEVLDSEIDKYDREPYYLMAQEIVKNNLKNPSSARFPSMVLNPQEISMSRKGNIVGVQSYVDAKNAMNAKVRENWLVEFEVIDISTFSCNPVYVNIGGKKSGTYIDLN